MNGAIATKNRDEVETQSRIFLLYIYEEIAWHCGQLDLTMGIICAVADRP